MQLTQAITQRRSIRAFEKKTVEKKILHSIFSQAQQAPSNCNSQPWQTYIVSGEKRDVLEQRLLAEIDTKKKPHPHFTSGLINFIDPHKNRQVQCAKALYQSMGVAYEDRKSRQELMSNNWRFFGAPHVAFFTMKKVFTEANAVDLGIYLQTVMLLMTEQGLGCCAQGALGLYPEPIFDLLPIPEDQAILVGLSFGYPDSTHPINQFNVGRVDVSESVQFIE